MNLDEIEGIAISKEGDENIILLRTKKEYIKLTFYPQQKLNKTKLTKNKYVSELENLDYFEYSSQ